MYLSLSGFLFEDNYASQSVSPAEFCRIAKSAGYEGVELRRTQVNLDTPERERKELLKIIQDHGLRVTCLTARGLPAGGPPRDEFLIRYLQLCRDMKCGLLKISGDTSWLSTASERAKDYGVVLAGNNHIGTDLETIEGTRNYFKKINHPNFSLLYDSLHLMVNGEDYLGCIPEFIDITRNILVHSVRPVRPGEKAGGESMQKHGKKWVSALPDEEGAQNWPEIFKRFKQSGYNGLNTVVESGWPEEKREYVARHCAGVLRHLLRG